MDLRVLQLGQLAQCQGRRGIGGRADGQGDQHLIGMQARVIITQVLGL